MIEEEEDECKRCHHEVGYHYCVSLYGKKYVNCGHVDRLGRVCPCERILER